MSETLTFGDFRVGRDSVYDIGDGVIPEMARAFGYELTPKPDAKNLEGLVGIVGPADELQLNITRVQERLGTDKSAVELTRSWVERSGFLVPVDRMYLSGDVADRTVYPIAIVRGGIANWIRRRQELLGQKIAEGVDVQTVLLVGSNRKMRAVERSDVTEGMTESEYLQELVAPQLGALSVGEVVVLTPQTINGGVVAAQAAGEIVAAVAAGFVDGYGHRTTGASRVVPTVVGNAGNWVQGAGAIRRALGRDVHVISDGFKLGTGTEPTITHQNPFTATGQIARNAVELTLQEVA